MRFRLATAASAALLALSATAMPALAKDAMTSEGAESGAMHRDSMAAEGGKGDKGGAMMREDGMKKGGAHKDSMSKASRDKH